MHKILINTNAACLWQKGITLEKFASERKTKLHPVAAVTVALVAAVVI